MAREKPKPPRPPNEHKALSPVASLCLPLDTADARDGEKFPTCHLFLGRVIGGSIGGLCDNDYSRL